MTTTLEAGEVGGRYTSLILVENSDSRDQIDDVTRRGYLFVLPNERQRELLSPYKAGGKP